jgi:hypothetical protein
VPYGPTFAEAAASHEVVDFSTMVLALLFRNTLYFPANEKRKELFNRKWFIGGMSGAI